MQFRDISITLYGGPPAYLQGLEQPFPQAAEGNRADDAEAAIAGGNPNWNEYVGVDDDVNEGQLFLFNDDLDDGDFEDIHADNNVICTYYYVLFLFQFFLCLCLLVLLYFFPYVASNCSLFSPFSEGRF
jgi:hypothetical protein